MKLFLLCLPLALLFFSGCACNKTAHVNNNKITVFAESDYQWTGVTASKDGHIFTCFPRWSNNNPLSVAEVVGDGSLRPFPSIEWNQWAPGLSTSNHFICVQSVFVDKSNALWVLDPANPFFKGVIPGGPKLIKFDLATGQPTRTILFDSKMAPKDSYLNDVRIDTIHNFAYISDSGLGALLVVDLNNGKIRRVFANDSSTKSDGSIVTVNGKQWKNTEGKFPQVHADGLALNPHAEDLFYQPLTGSVVYRIKTKYLRDFKLPEYILKENIKIFGYFGPGDGMFFDPQGNLYVATPDHNAVRKIDTLNRVCPVAINKELSWPDSITMLPDGNLLVSSSQIHKGQKPDLPYKLIKIIIED